jgi:hypothetical protein
MFGVLIWEVCSRREPHDKYLDICAFDHNLYFNNHYLSLFFVSIRYDIYVAARKIRKGATPRSLANCPPAICAFPLAPPQQTIFQPSLTLYYSNVIKQMLDIRTSR